MQYEEEERGYIKGDDGDERRCEADSLPVGSFRFEYEISIEV